MRSRFSRRWLAAFELFFRPWMRRRLGAVRMAGLPRHLPPRTPLLLVANHVSWWDGFVLREVHRLLRPDAPLYTVMLSDELARRPWMRLLGAAGMDPASASSVAHLLRDLRRWRQERPDCVIAFFPQGRIWPSYRRPLGFRRGVELFVRHLDPALVLPVGVHLEPLNRANPRAFASVGSPLPSADAGLDAGALERRVEAELDRILAFAATHGEEMDQRWPGTHGQLPTVAFEALQISGAGEVRP